MYRYTFDVIGAVFFGKQFGFLEDSHDYGKYIESVHLAMPFLSVVAMAPHYCRPILMATAVTIPSLLKAVIAVNGIRTISITNTKQQMKNSEDTTSKRRDILAQLLTVVHEKGEKVDLSHNDVTAEMWSGM
jgi:hypothetical protein